MQFVLATRLREIPKNDTAGEFKRTRPETALACAISPAPGSDTPESDSNVRVTLRRWPYEMNSPAVSLLVQLEGPKGNKPPDSSQIETVSTLFIKAFPVVPDILSTALFSLG